MQPRLLCNHQRAINCKADDPSPCKRPHGRWDVHLFQRLRTTFSACSISRDSLLPPCLTAAHFFIQLHVIHPKVKSTSQMDDRKASYGLTESVQVRPLHQPSESAIDGEG